MTARAPPAGHTYAFRDRPLPQALDALAELGFEQVEVWVGHAARNADRAAELLRQRGLAAVAVGAGGVYRPGEATIERAFELAGALGARVVVACVRPTLLPDVARHVPSSSVLCLENHWDHELARPGDVLAALAPYPQLRACLDTGHALLAGVRPERFAAALGLRLGHVHVKEGRLRSPLERALGRRLRRRLLPRPEPVAPGSGRLSVARLRTALSECGYGGAISLEHEGEQAADALAALLAAWRSAA